MVQLTSDGKLRILFLRESPIGEKQSTIWRYFLQRSMKKAIYSDGVPARHLF